MARSFYRFSNHSLMQSAAPRHPSGGNLTAVGNKPPDKSNVLIVDPFLFNAKNARPFLSLFERRLFWLSCFPGHQNPPLKRNFIPGFISYPKFFFRLAGTWLSAQHLHVAGNYFSDSLFLPVFPGIPADLQSSLNRDRIPFF